jgi:hypothetical protein
MLLNIALGALLLWHIFVFGDVLHSQLARFRRPPGIRANGQAGRC